MERLKTFNVSISNGSTKEFFTAKIDFADADIKSLNILHTLFDKYLDHMLVKCEQCMTYTKF